jgi:hypothetical protein
LPVYQVPGLDPARQTQIPLCISGELTTAPSGKFGAEPTIMIVLILLLVSEILGRGVADIHCSSHPFDIGLSGGVVDGYDVEFDLEVLAGFPESSVS